MRALKIEVKVSYNEFFKIFIDKKFRKTDLRKIADIAPNTLTKIRRSKTVSIDVLLSVCDKLDCIIGEIMDVVKEF